VFHRERRFVVRRDLEDHDLPQVPYPEPDEGTNESMNEPRKIRRPSAARPAILCIGYLALATLGASAAWGEEILVDGIAAQVGGEIVLASEIEEMTRPVIERMKAANVPKSEMVGLRKDALERLIEARLIDDVVRQYGLSASDEEIDQAIDGIAQETGLSLAQLAESVAGYGMSFDDYRDKIRSEIERNKVLNAMVRSKIQIDPLEVRDLYAQRYADQKSGGEEVHLRHILVTFDPERGRDRASACGMLSKAREVILAGNASFQEVARKVSDANPNTGGDLGWIHMSELAGWMAVPLKDLDHNNRITPVIEMPFGCNLLELVDRRPFQPITLGEATPQLEAELFRIKTEQEYIRWVESLREHTYVERMGIYAASGVQTEPTTGP
jgi:peptidyl-prolyl cis-trans isomerase SurA